MTTSAWREQRVAIGVDAAVVHERVPGRGDQDRVDDEVGEESLARESGHLLHGRRLGEHAGLDGAHFEVGDDAEDLGDDHVGVDVLHRRHAHRVLGGDRREGRRGVHLEGAKGAQVGLNAGPTTGVRPRDRENGEGLHLNNLNEAALAVSTIETWEISFKSAR